MSFGGPGMLPFLMADNAVDTDAHRVPKTQTQHFVYAAGHGGWTAGDYSAKGINVV
jgi:hypothetical protein